MSEPESSPPPPPADAPIGEEMETPTGEARPARKVKTVGVLHYLAMLPLYWVTRVWLATLRMRISAEEQAFLSDTRTPLITVVWHNRLFITSELRRRYRHTRPMVGLVSASADGAWLAEYFRLTGIQTVRGSSSWRGMQAVRELLAAMKAGSDIAITPDGPRGPCYEIQPGALLVARLSKVPLLLISAHFQSAWRLRSWDGFYLPKPFSVVG
ncbi:MAG: lysophospholipid acyltransferase family protein, partial [Opitutales bacterium]